MGAESLGAVSWVLREASSVKQGTLIKLSLSPKVEDW